MRNDFLYHTERICKDIKSRRYFQIATLTCMLQCSADSSTSRARAKLSTNDNIIFPQPHISTCHSWFIMSILFFYLSRPRMNAFVLARRRSTPLTQEHAWDIMTLVTNSKNILHDACVCSMHAFIHSSRPAGHLATKPTVTTTHEHWHGLTTLTHTKLPP